MSFIENARFPEDLSVWAKGGMEFKTTITENDGGFEQRNQNWSQTRAIYTINMGEVTKQASGPLSYNNLQNFFNACRGRLYGFRFKDFQDYKASTGSGCLDNGVGTGKPTYQLTKKYAVANFSFYREIYKPVVGTFKLYKNGIEQTTGFTIDYTTGIITLASSNTKTISTISTGGTTCTITTSTAHNLVNGTSVYITTTNTSNTVLNKKVFVATVINTTQFTISASNLLSGTGTMNVYAQPTDFLTAEYEFDVPARFDIDTLNAGMSTSGLIELDNITIVELRVK